MTQPDCRQLLSNLLRLAKDAYEMRLQHFKRTGHDVLPPIKRLPDQPTNPRPPFTLDGRRFFQAITISREDMNNYPFTQLGFAAQKVFRYPKSLWSASVTPSEETKELLNMLKFVGGDNEDRGENTKIDKLNRIMELTQSILDGKAMSAKEHPILVPELPKTIPAGLSKPYDGGKFVFCVDKKVKVPPCLQDALKAYLDGEPSIDVGASNPYQIQTRLKKLIIELWDGGFEPAMKRWPRGSNKTGNMVYFDSTIGEVTRKSDNKLATSCNKALKPPRKQAV